MKKFLGIIVALATLTTSLTTTVFANAEDIIDTETTTTTYASGDFDHDGVVSAKDIRFLFVNYAYCLSLYNYSVDENDVDENDEKNRQVALKYYEEKLGYTEEDYDAMDLNGDGLVNTAEATTLMTHFVATHFGYVNESGVLNLEVQLDEKKYLDNLYAENPEYKELVNKYDDELEYCCSNSYKHELARELGYADGSGYIRELDDEFYTVYDEKLIEFSDINMGDSNLDGEVDANDAVVVLQDYAGALANNTADELYEVGDLKSFNEDTNYDSVIDSQDAVIILQDYAENLAEGN